MSPRAAALGARGVFAAFALVIAGHVAFLGWAAPLGHPRVVLVLALAVVAAGGLGLWLAWWSLVRNAAWARWWGYGFLTAYSLVLLLVAFFPEAHPNDPVEGILLRVLTYLGLLWGGSLLGNLLAWRAAQS